MHRGYLIGWVALVTLTGGGLSACTSGSTAGTEPAGSARPAPTSNAPRSKIAPTIAVSSTTLQVGGQVTVSGSRCEPGFLGKVALEQSPTGGPQVSYPFYEDLGQAAVRADGRWTITTSVPAAIIGASKLAAFCEDPSVGTAALTYRSVPVTVTTPYVLQVTPGTTMHAGGILDVGSGGGGCDAISNPDVFLWSPSAHPPDNLTGIGEVVGPTGDGGPWHVPLTVPASTEPGQYEVIGRCIYSRSIRITYEPVPVTIDAP